MKTRLEDKRTQLILKPGDLVGHKLYGKEWLAVVIRLDAASSRLAKKVEVRMIPGSDYENFFSGRHKYRTGSGRGWISIRWLLEVKGSFS